jgi:putative CocE/NonD family hydrolase
MLARRFACLLLLLGVIPSVVRAAAPPDTAPADESPADVAYLREHYTKYEYKIPMRDGAHLFTAAYVPKDAATTYPMLLARTPYGLRPYGASNYPTPRGPMKHYAKDRFIFVYQDVRGRNASEGEFVHVRPHVVGKGPTDIDESSDTFDTIEWLVKHVPLNNGRVGLVGISYPGFYAAAGMIDAHPALKCVSPQAPVTDWFLGDDFRHNGALYLAHSFRFLSFFGQPLAKPTREQPVPVDYATPDGYEFYLHLGPLEDAAKTRFEKGLLFWDELLAHDTYDDFWKARRITPHLKNIRPAVMTVGGWYDAEDLYGPLHIYRATEDASPGAVNMLVIGPWSHGAWHNGDGESLGHVRFHQKTAHYYRRQIELPFLNHYLKDGPDPKLPEAFVFETGTNQWRRYDTWPPKNTVTRTLYFHPRGRLSFEPPGESSGAKEQLSSREGGDSSSPRGDSAATTPLKPQDSGLKPPPYDQYESDPSKPVPFIPNIAIGMTTEHMLDDQRFASSRTDVLVYTTEPLSEDITIAGPISPRLFVSTTGTDGDWVVKLIDVYSGDYPNPDPNPAGVQMGGYQQLVRGEVMRGKFRNSFEKPVPFEPGQITRVAYTMPDAYHTFRRGHRIMVHVQSSWFPLVDRNPQKFMPIAKAKAEDFQKATQRVYRTGDGMSGVQIQVLP